MREATEDGRVVTRMGVRGRRRDGSTGASRGPAGGSKEEEEDMLAAVSTNFWSSVLRLDWITVCVLVVVIRGCPGAWLQAGGTAGGSKVLQDVWTVAS